MIAELKPGPLEALPPEPPWPSGPGGAGAAAEELAAGGGDDGVDDAGGGFESIGFESTGFESRGFESIGLAANLFTARGACAGGAEEEVPGGAVEDADTCLTTVVVETG